MIDAFRRLTIRQRLIVWHVGLLTVVLSTFSGVLFAFVQKSLYDNADAALRAAAVNLARLHVQSSPGMWEIDGQGSLMERMLGFRYRNKYAQVVDISGQRPPEWLDEQRDDFPLTQLALRNAAEGKMTFETFRNLGPYPVRVITMPVIVEGRLTDNIVQVGASLEGVEGALNRLGWTILLLLPGVLVAASVGGWLLANEALKPVDRVTRTARFITARNLKERLAKMETDDEIGRLVQTFNEMLERLDKSFEQVQSFTADASHELKTPLTILKGEIELALRRERPAREYQEILVSALEEIERLTRITSDLLLLAKSDAGAVQLDISQVNLSKLIEEAALHYQALLDEKHVVLEVLPGRHDVVIEGDPFRLKQAILNLIENAIAYTPSGGRVVVRAGWSNAFYALLQISDTGIGIAEEEKARIFERFYRADKARSRREGGTGLGLSIVRWVVESHGGRIEVDSRPQRGSTFTIFLPVHHGEKRLPPERAPVLWAFDRDDLSTTLH